MKEWMKGYLKGYLIGSVVMLPMGIVCYGITVLINKITNK